eukprot:GHVS01015041.1.p1 GENE.GHVS01015041.1~~GHVS01015041.1.p1  ORF type:complete len:519 (-),score=64.17 GHVS01015041.1:61-1617(-)
MKSLSVVAHHHIRWSYQLHHHPYYPTAVAGRRFHTTESARYDTQQLQQYPIKHIRDLQPTDMSRWRLHCRVVSKSNPTYSHQANLLLAAAYLRDVMGDDIMLRVEGSASNRIQIFSQLVEGKTYAISGGSIAAFGGTNNAHAVIIDDVCGNVEELHDDQSINDRPFCKFADLPAPPAVVCSPNDNTITTTTSDISVGCTTSDISVGCTTSSRPVAELFNIVGVVTHIYGEVKVKSGDVGRSLKLIDDSGATAWLFLVSLDTHKRLNVGNIVVVRSVTNRLTVNNRPFTVHDRFLKLPWGSSWSHASPDMPEAITVADWWTQRERSTSAVNEIRERPSQGGHNTAPHSSLHTRWFLKELVGDQAATADSRAARFKTYRVSGRINHITPDRIYFACCVSCNRSVRRTEGSDGWRCTNCATLQDKPNFRYSLNVHIADGRGDILPAIAFGNVGEAMLGVSVDMLRIAEVTGKTETGQSVDDILSAAVQQRWSLAIRPPNNNAFTTAGHSRNYVITSAEPEE